MARIPAALQSISVTHWRFNWWRWQQPEPLQKQRWTAVADGDECALTSDAGCRVIFPWASTRLQFSMMDVPGNQCASPLTKLLIEVPIASVHRNEAADQAALLPPPGGPSSSHTVMFGLVAEAADWAHAGIWQAAQAHSQRAGGAAAIPSWLPQTQWPGVWRVAQVGWLRRLATLLIPAVVLVASAVSLFNALRSIYYSVDAVQAALNSVITAIHEALGPHWAVLVDRVSDGLYLLSTGIAPLLVAGSRLIGPLVAPLTALCGLLMRASAPLYALLAAVVGPLWTLGARVLVPLATLLFKPLTLLWALVNKCGTSVLALLFKLWSGVSGIVSALLSLASRAPLLRNMFRAAQSSAAVAAQGAATAAAVATAATDAGVPAQVSRLNTFRSHVTDFITRTQQRLAGVQPAIQGLSTALTPLKEAAARGAKAITGALTGITELQRHTEGGTPRSGTAEAAVTTPTAASVSAFTGVDDDGEDEGGDSNSSAVAAAGNATPATPTARLDFTSPAGIRYRGTGVPPSPTE